jgi:hypothetical protein
MLSSDPSFSWKNSDLISSDSLEKRLSTQNTLSWDLFDTLIYRENGQPDLAKFKVGQVLHEAGVLAEPWAYVQMRNQVEEDARKSLRINQDVPLEAITKKIVTKYLQDCNFTSHELAAMEFQFDLGELRPRPGIVEVYNRFAPKSILITDIYYSQEQVETKPFEGKNGPCLHDLSVFDKEIGSYLRIPFEQLHRLIIPGNQ